VGSSRWQVANTQRANNQWHNSLWLATRWQCNQASNMHSNQWVDPDLLKSSSLQTIPAAAISSEKAINIDVKNIYFRPLDI